MKATLLLVLLLTTSAFAADYTNLNLNLTFVPNTGSGDNLAGTIIGSGVNLSFSGGTNGFFVTSQYWPGSSFPLPLGIFPDYVSGTPYLQSLGSANIFISSFTFATNDQNFTITLPGSVGPFQGPGLTLVTNPGNFTLSFAFSAFYGAYSPVSGSFVSAVPEPGSWLLVGTGLLAVARMVALRR